MYRLLILITLALGAVGLNYLLHQESDLSKGVSGGFRRSMASGLLEKIQDYSVESSCYIAGLMDSAVYLGCVRKPTQVAILANSKWQFQTIDMAGFPVHASSVSVEASRFYLEDLVTYAVYSGSIQDWKIDCLAFDSAFFSEAVPISKTSIIRRTISRDKYEYTFTKEMCNHTTSNDTLLQRQIDGLFCTDGMLRYSSGTGRLTYVYFYRNEFFCADTSLNLLFRAHTIDTISRARIEVANVHSENSIKLSSPPFIVNSKSYVDEDDLYVNSKIRADNERLRDFENGSVIDVYDLGANGTYRYSFYVPLFKGKRIRSFAVKNDLLMALYDERLITYRMQK